jgi:hypothetical protein
METLGRENYASTLDRMNEIRLGEPLCPDPFCILHIEKLASGLLQSPIAKSTESNSGELSCKLFVKSTNLTPSPTLSAPSYTLYVHIFIIIIIIIVTDTLPLNRVTNARHWIGYHCPIVKAI